MSKVSVIIPCFNQGQYLHDAVNSVLDQTYADFEIIIVNDGSTESYTKNLLETFNRPKTRVVHTSNQGLASARNNGIREASGIYILPLDADDKIEPEYMRKAVDLLDNDEELGIIYCLGKFFGERKGIFYLNEFNLKNMLLDSRIFCSAFFRRDDWALVKGYNPNMIYGWEDWDFWLSIIELGRKTFMIPEILFKCRSRKKSMIRSMTTQQKIDMHVQLFRNHHELYMANIRSLFEESYRLKNSPWARVEQIGRMSAFDFRVWKKQTIKRIRAVSRNMLLETGRKLFVGMPYKYRLMVIKLLNNVFFYICSKK